MLSSLDNIDDFLSDVAVGSELPNISPSQQSIKNTALAEIEQNPIDYRLRQLSYSSLLTLHSCPRKYQLYKHSAKAAAIDAESNITFAFGHIVGEAIQLVLGGADKKDIVLKMFLGWHAPLFAENSKKAKSFWDAMIALERFISMRDSGFLEDYELVIYQDKPATELSFCINLPDGFRLRGFVDAVLRNTVTGEIMVLECKTTGNNVNPTTYKNSSQAIGYSIVLDVLFPELSSYDVLYLVYKTTDQEYHSIPFSKSYSQRARWIKELILDIETIKMYASEDMFPMHGESCFSFWKDCEYLNTCTLSDQHILPAFNPDKHIDLTEYQINISLLDLVNAQLSKTAASFDAAEFNSSPAGELGEML